MNGTKPLTIKHHSLTGRITLQVMDEAFRAVRKNRGAAGVDQVSSAMFEANLEQNLLKLMRQLKTGTFQPRPARRSYIDKGGGKKRPLGIPCVRDRVAQEVLRRLLTPLFEPLFHDQSLSLPIVAAGSIPCIHRRASFTHRATPAELPQLRNTDRQSSGAGRKSHSEISPSRR